MVDTGHKSPDIVGGSLHTHLKKAQGGSQSPPCLLLGGLRVESRMYLVLLDGDSGGS